MFSGFGALLEVFCFLTLWPPLEACEFHSAWVILLCPPLGNKNSAQSFSDRSFWKSLRVVDVRAFGSWMSAPKCLLGERQSIAQKAVRAIDARDSQLEMARMLQIPVFALAG